jgi:hypothetical protein
MHGMKGVYLTNEHGKVLDISGNVDAENRDCVWWNKNDKLSQQWDLVYADEMPRDPVKGELNEKFGLYVERPFYIVT